jgi:hypothetical protein
MSVSVGDWCPSPFSLLLLPPCGGTWSGTPSELPCSSSAGSDTPPSTSASLSFHPDSKKECGEKEEEKEENEREQALDLNNNILSNTGVLDCSIKMLWFRPI